MLEHGNVMLNIKTAHKRSRQENEAIDSILKFLDGAIKGQYGLIQFELMFWLGFLAWPTFAKMVEQKIRTGNRNSETANMKNWIEEFLQSHGIEITTGDNKT